MKKFNKMGKLLTRLNKSSLMAEWVKNPPASAGETADLGQPLGREDPLEKEIAAHFSILA